MHTFIRHILVPLDFTTDQDGVITLARTLAGSLGAVVHFVHVLAEPYVTPGAYQFHLPDTPERRERRYNQARVRMRVAAEMFNEHGITTTVEARGGIPVDEIVDAAIDYGADLIVMGTHGRSGFQHLLAGSVAEQVIRRARCPVLTVRTGDAAAAQWPAAGHAKSA